MTMPDVPDTSPEQPEGSEVNEQPEGEQGPKKPTMPTKHYDFDWESLPDGVREYIRDLRGENKDRREYSSHLQSQIDELKTWKQGMDQAQLDQLKEEGNYQELAVRHAQRLAELEPKAQRLEQLESLLRANNAQRISKLPITVREAVQELTLAPDQLAAWLDKYGDSLSTPPAPPPEGGRGVTPGVKPTSNVTQADKDTAAYLKQIGINASPEGIARRRERGTPIVRETDDIEQ